MAGEIVVVIASSANTNSNSIRKSHRVPMMLMVRSSCDSYSRSNGNNSTYLAMKYIHLYIYIYICLYVCIHRLARTSSFHFIFHATSNLISHDSSIANPQSVPWEDYASLEAHDLYPAPVPHYVILKLALKLGSEKRLASSCGDSPNGMKSGCWASTHNPNIL